MKLIIEYNANQNKFDFTSNVQIDIETDAKALGYITNVLFESALRFAELAQSANPKYAPAIDAGIKFSMLEKERENNDKYPFTTFLQKDET